MWTNFLSTLKNEFLLHKLAHLRVLKKFEYTLTCQIIVQQILLFFGGKNIYTSLLGPTYLLISEIFPSKPDFHLHKQEKILPTCVYMDLSRPKSQFPSAIGWRKKKVPAIIIKQ